MPIVSRQGQYVSTRTRQETEDLLRKDLARLSESEREVLKQLLAELQGGGSQLVTAMRSVEYVRPLVSMREFVKNPYYLGHTSDGLYPVLLRDLERLFSGGYHECYFTGSVGFGKSFTASIGVCRVLYELSCLRNPHQVFGLAQDSNLSILCLSVNEELATKVAFENIATKIKASPYFQEHFPFKPTKKELRFPNNIWVAARATTDTSALGLNPISAFLDEVNFMPNKGKAAHAMGAVDHAEVIYNSIQRRMKSRFQKAGKLPGMLFVVSSKRSSDDFTERKIRESKQDPTVFVVDHTIWDVKPENYSDKRFQVLVGNDTVPSRILAPDEVDRVRIATKGELIIIDVPEDFRSDFERDLEGSLRDLAGQSTVSVSPFIQRREKIAAAFQLDATKYKPNRHPFPWESYDPSQGGSFLWEKMVAQYEVAGNRTVNASGDIERVLRPIINPHAPRHVHIDTSLTGDCTGICMAHIAEWRDVIRRHDDQQFLERAPVYVVDFVLRVVPPPGEEIIMGDLRRMIYELSQHGYAIAKVTYDRFQSADMGQILNQKGYNTEVLSCDTSMDPYENLKLALYEDRVYIYEYLPLAKELQQLEKDLKRRKVDHPAKGSKDVSDALAGCCFSLRELRSSSPLPILRGSSQYSDAWMPEQKQAVWAGNSAAGKNENVADSSTLLPFLLGGRDEGF